MTILKPNCSFPLPKTATSVKTDELTIVAPRKAKNFREVDSAVLSSVSFVKLGKIDAIGTFTNVYAKDKPRYVHMHTLIFLN